LRDSVFSVRGGKEFGRVRKNTLAKSDG